MEKIIFSLLTFGWYMNNTINNQGDHCIVAHCELGKLVGTDSNQMLILSNIKECEGSAQDEIGTLQKFASKLFSLTQ